MGSNPATPAKKDMIWNISDNDVLRNGNTQTVAWIEEKGAKEGFSVTFKHGEESEWWKVLSVGTSRHTKDEAYARERDYLRQRKASDVKSGSHEKF